MTIQVAACLLAVASARVVEMEVGREVVGQTEQYEALRARFLERFSHDSRVASGIDPTEGGRKVHFGDQTVYMGQALLVFSTEMALTRSMRGDPSESGRLIARTLDAIDELDLKAESLFGAEPSLNGFFVRDDIDGPQDPRLQGRFAEVDSDWQEPGDASPSGDQIFGLMYGLLGVVRFSGDEHLIEHAKQISNRLYRYAADSRFILKMPDGEATERGSDVR